MKLLLGCIADDFTGATDVASVLAQEGMNAVLAVGVPTGPVPEAEAIVVALKTRTAPAEQAVAESLTACDWLKDAGARQIYFKYCSTFDSTPQGNVGPVAMALAQSLDASLAIACPAFPTNGRTVFRGHLFVGDQLLSESGMRHHPLTPMTDANLVRVLQLQTTARVGLIRHDAVRHGPSGVRQVAQALQDDGVRIAIADATSDDDLRTLAEVCVEHPLITASSGVALGLPAAYARRGWLVADSQAAPLREVGGAAAVLSGSCSMASNRQTKHWINAGRPSFRFDTLALAAGEAELARAIEFGRQRLAVGPVLFYATAEPAAVKSVQEKLGTGEAGAVVERAMGDLAAAIVRMGVRRLVVAGGETSGAVVQALGVKRMRIGPTIDPGVPWVEVLDRPPEQPLLLSLKSGNFGTDDFFVKAFSMVS